ncbi:MAG: hydroxyacid dehydrogenase [Desulfomonilia bacterium]|nr:hydroxyacid dehydrogenase [Desulfomonilia bacterium]
MKITIFETEPWEQDIYRKLGADHEVVFLTESLGQQNAGDHRDTDIVSTFIYSSLDEAVLKQLPSLKLIATRSTGYDHIDIEYCSEHDIQIANVPSYGTCPVAEHVFGLILVISHNLNEAINRTRRGEFSLAGLKGFDLHGRVLGVVGTGSIGTCVIRIARGFGMEVHAFDVNPDEALSSELGFTYSPLNTLLGSSDIVTLHVPANKHTRHLISEEQFGQMKDGSILINTSRGTIVDVQALIQALATGKIAAAGLDVLPDEPVIREEAELLRSVFQKKYDLETLLADHILLRLRNVYITPHSAFYTQEALLDILNTTLDNIQAFVQGSPQNVVQ